MKKFGSWTLSLLLIGMVSCRNGQRADAENRRAEAVEETREKGMEKHREWSGASETEQDSAAQKRDSIPSDTTRSRGQKLKRDQKP